jgi:hypothetical protein
VNAGWRWNLSDSGEWKTVIVGLTIIRKLLAGEDVELESIRVNLIPDDVLFNARRAREAGGVPEREGRSDG